jgi:hypothetical protein
MALLLLKDEKKAIAINATVSYTVHFVISLETCDQQLAFSFFHDVKSVPLTHFCLSSCAATIFREKGLNV